jgi:hypothetical protein
LQTSQKPLNHTHRKSGLIFQTLPGKTLNIRPNIMQTFYSLIAEFLLPADNVKRATSEAMAVDAELSAYSSLLSMYVRLICRMRLAHIYGRFSV